MLFRGHQKTSYLVPIYGYFWCWLFYKDWKYGKYVKSMHGNVGAAYGEGLAYWYILLILTGGMAVVGYLIKASPNTEHKEFYYVMSFVFAVAVGILLIAF